MTTSGRSWYAFFISFVSGTLITIGIFALTQNRVATITLGLGIYGVIYFVSVGLTAASNHLADIKRDIKAR